ncbi:DNA-binding response regulator, NarL/FixJ family, contains REC and HTH domains [Algoriphagus locisalis]|uniref:DNA-binding response regulator, NarL/FixJ family, contains REC and HTH domains n=1 Tax=Algoriphagus locisalis TaxID=305507 RepID=A0A1I7E5R3_9BACT|nr:response regulator transcription factor [Algoriphagus locisalis]SFU19249.1 DNA-binding response regulator, NarL/FixJ family, contains REC and HTH domains [Algoriphagus locisalis]
MIRLGIIEDDEQIREMLTGYFYGQPGFSCLLSAYSVESFFEQWDEGIFLDIILSDIGLPGESGIKGVQRIKKHAPKCQVIMLTVYDDSRRIFQALCNGASGYLLKQTPLQKIKEAVVTLHEGGAPMSPGVARKVVEYFNPKHTEDLQEKLTPREAQVVEAIEEGLTNKEVAIRLDISLETVKYHVKNIYEKLEVNSRHGLISRKYK